MDRLALASSVVMAPQRDSTPVPAIRRFATACTRCPCIARARCLEVCIIVMHGPGMLSWSSGRNAGMRVACFP